VEYSPVAAAAAAVTVLLLVVIAAAVVIAAFHYGCPESTPRSLHVGFVVDKVALGQVFLRFLRNLPVSIIPPLLLSAL
jgi:hypothetical protein